MIRPIRVTSLSFSPIPRDGRVLRQLRALAARYEVTVVGYDSAGDALPNDLAGRVRFEVLARPASRGPGDRLAKAALLALGRVAPTVAYPRWYDRYALYREAATVVGATAPDLVVANDWNALPAASEAAGVVGAATLVDLHEYATRQWEHRRRWRLLWRPAIDFFLRRHLPRADAVVTISPSFAAAYARDYGVRPLVVRNAPPRFDLPPPRPCDPSRVLLVHHGVAGRDRQLERTIDAVVGAGRPYHLDLMLVPGDEAYIRELRRRVEGRAPGAVRIRAPVPPDDIVPTVAEYDLGLMIIPPISFHYRHALPNKLFEIVGAGVGVCTAPSPDMAAFVTEHGCGAVAEGFAAEDMSRLLRALTAADIDRFKARAREARQLVNADSEAVMLLEAAETALAIRGERRPQSTA